ncbi:hypothetical protein [Bradyrhizobium sp. SZCCHNPS2010]|uniref:hypothetical protein n=1 Tax=Bradyrhizobium sp. SZCCHNPS2010 TaxID=3057333 RepID=UPI00291655A6|nr:hypothetical protein [Bradyrhizobium sp. SZCCHNPS2010]
METIEAYLNRKGAELRLLNGCLRSPLALVQPRSVDQVILDKFQLTARLKAEHALSHWAITETAWAHPGQPRSGPFAFDYDYQRADLDVHGPSFYDLDADCTCETLYTASGMAAISALLLASAQVIGQADLIVLPGTYGETLELIEGYARHLHLVTAKRSLEETIATTSSPRLMLLDACAPAASFEAALRCMRPAFELLIFDGTCLSTGSGRIRRVLNWARRWNIPVVMVRSHTKLDSLGAEYGRLGSAVFLHRKSDGSLPIESKLEQLSAEMRNAVRLLGGAALPAHFPPYVGTSAYRELTNRRMAAILHNTRRAARYFASALPGLTEELRFAHALYVTLGSTKPLDETTARRAAASMSDDLAAAGLPIRHAGSFGFDFAATEWFHSAATDRYSVRVAVPDLPTALWDDLADAIANWWSAPQGTTRPARRPTHVA